MVSRLKEFIAQTGLTVRAFAIKCGLPQNTLSNQLNGVREISNKTIYAVANTFPTLSMDWIFRGEGSMLKDDDTIERKDLERINKLTDAIATLQEVINMKTEIITKLEERIQQLESQLK